MTYSMRLILPLALMLFGCGGGGDGDDSEPNPNPSEPEVSAEIRFNEIVSSNDGVAVDEEGQTEDWLELINMSDQGINLAGYSISDKGEEPFVLPNVVIEANSVLVFWADDDVGDEGLHLPFKLSSSGESMSLFDSSGVLIDSLEVPALEANEAYARYSDDTFDICRYPSISRDNGDCELSTVAAIDDDITFEAFTQEQWPQISPDSLAINELSLFPTGFIEVKNFSETAIKLSNFVLTATAYTPNSSVPETDIGLDASSISLADITLSPGELYVINITEDFLSQITAQEYREGVISLFYNDEVTDAELIDFVPFMHWPEGNALARSSTDTNRFQFCQNTTADEDNLCTELASREILERARGLYTPGDFSALASGSGKLNIESVKFVIDIENKNAVHFLSSESWPLHYSFVREVIDAEESLDRCDATENITFNSGWSNFSLENYFNSDTRRYHLGTLSKHSSADLNNLEFTFGDVILATQMLETFYTLMPLTQSPYDWSLRPQNDSQVEKARSIEGQLPIVSTNAPFADIVFQGLTTGVAYGTLMYVETQDLEDTLLGNRAIVITNDVPNDIDFVGGLITEAFQTPLAHVNILSQSRNTPNMALPDASENPEFTALMNKLVRLEVTASGYTIEEADLAEAEAFWDAQTQQTDVLVPRLNALATGLIDLETASFESLPIIGAKAAQLSELFKVSGVSSSCSEGAHFDYPVGAFAIPMSYYLDHYADSGAEDYIADLLLEDAFFSDAAYRKASLETARSMIMDHEVDSELLASVTELMEERYGNDRVRFRSSSNTEDLADFNGAGLYESISAELGDEDRPVDTAIKTVWASLWNLRAFEERDYANVEQTSVAMAVLVHAAFTNERANGVGVGRNILNPIRGDQFYFNTQAGEASVTNPAPGIVTEQLVYQWPPRTPSFSYQSNSSLIDGEVIDETEVRELACALDAVQEHFRELLDPNDEDRYFTMETEFKFLGEERTLLLKQARPYPFQNLDVPNDCRDF